MITDYIVLKGDAYCAKSNGETRSHVINNRNEKKEAESLEVDFRRRVVWVVSGREKYFIPFEAVSMINASRADADAELNQNGSANKRGNR